VTRTAITPMTATKPDAPIEALSLTVAAGENHALMFVQDATCAFVREIARGHAGDRHGALYELFRRAGHAQLDALALEFTVARLFSGGLFSTWRCGHGTLPHAHNVREYAVPFKGAFEESESPRHIYARPRINGQSVSGRNRDMDHVTWIGGRARIVPTRRRKCF